MKIIVETIPASRMRYPTKGDWLYYRDGSLHVFVSKDGLTENEQFLIGLHEMVEVWLCRARGVTQQQVDEFDMVRAPALALPDDAEPGDHPEAPYRREHRFAMLIEHLMAHELGMAGYGVVR